jgi:hypothetical protein
MQALKTRAIRWGARAIAAIKEADPALPDCLYNRDRDNWRPLIAVAQTAGGHWPETSCTIAAAFNGQGEDPSEGVMLLADIRQIVERRYKSADRISTGDLLEALHADEHRPWHDYQEEGFGITSRQLARLLKLFGIHPKSVRIDEGTPKGYMTAAFEDAWGRYLPGGTP